MLLIIILGHAYVNKKYLLIYYPLYDNNKTFIFKIINCIVSKVTSESICHDLVK